MRLAQTTNGSTTRYLVDTQRRYSEVVGAITPESETWYLLGLDILGQQQGSDWSYFAYDGLGSVRLALDINGSPRAGMRYEPYGQPAASWGTPPALGFTGEWTDSSGLLYLRARYLDPSSATFLSRDPFEGLPTRALSRNGYSWVEGNPINYVDPSGEMAEAVWGAAFGFLGPLGPVVTALAPAVLAVGALVALGIFCVAILPPVIQKIQEMLAPPGPQPIPGWAGGGGTAIPLPGQGTVARPKSQANAQATATAIAPAIPQVTAVPTAEPHLFYFREAGPYNAPGRGVIELEHDLYPFTHIQGLAGILAHIKSDQARLDAGEEWVQYRLTGRKFELERALSYARLGILARANTSASNFDLQINGYGTITHVEVKWSNGPLPSTTICCGRGSVVVEARSHAPGAYLLEAVQLDPLGKAALIQHGGVELP